MVAFNNLVFVANDTATIALDAFNGRIVYSIIGVGNVQKIGPNQMLMGSNCYAIDTGASVESPCRILCRPIDNVWRRCHGQ